MLEECLSCGEKLVIWRARKGLTIQQAAKRRKTDVYTYKAWELDEIEGPKVKLNGIEVCEHYQVLRLRCRWSRTELGRRMGITRQDLTNMERGRKPIKSLIRFWES